MQNKTQLDDTNILIVDDEAGIRDLFGMIVNAYLPNLHCDEAHDGAEAIERFKCGHHAVLLMDLHMPVLDGLASFERLCDVCRSDNHEMPAVIFCTGYAPPDSVMQIVRRDHRHCLLKKPVRAEVLLGAIRERLPPHPPRLDAV